VGNVIPTYRWLRNVSSLGRLLQVVVHYFMRLRIIIIKLQVVGKRLDSLIVKLVDILCRCVFSGNLSDYERAKFMFFIHKVVLLSFIIGYLAGYFMSH